MGKYATAREKVRLLEEELNSFMNSDHRDLTIEEVKERFDYLKRKLGHSKAILQAIGRSTIIKINLFGGKFDGTNLYLPDFSYEDIPEYMDDNYPGAGYGFSIILGGKLTKL